METLVVILIVAVATGFLGYWLWRALSGRSRCSCDSMPSCNSCTEIPSFTEHHDD